MQGISVPATQSTLNYLLTGAVYGSLHLRSRLSSSKAQHPKPSRSASGRGLWAKCAAIAVLDVEATYVNVLAYRFTSLTSVTLLDCTTIPGDPKCTLRPASCAEVLLLSWLLLGAWFTSLPM